MLDEKSPLDKMNLIIDHKISVYDVLRAKAAKWNDDADIEDHMRRAAVDLSCAIRDLASEDPVRVLGIACCSLVAPIAVCHLMDEIGSGEACRIEDDEE